MLHDLYPIVVLASASARIPFPVIALGARQQTADQYLASHEQQQLVLRHPVDAGDNDLGICFR